MKPLIIHTSAMPRAFKKKIPEGIDYYYNKSAWMTGDIFTKYLTKFNLIMKTQNRHVLLLIDNAPVHSHPTLSNVTIKFLPPNTTGETQPLDGGIIKNFKLYYRKHLLKHMVDDLDTYQKNAELVVKSINLAMAIQWIKSGWNKVSVNTVQNCWSHCGFSIAAPTEALANEDFRIEEDLTAVAQVMQIADPCADFENPPAYEIIEDGDWENHVLFGLEPIDENVEGELENSVEHDDVEIIQPAVTHQEANEAWQTLRRYFYETQDNELLPLIDTISDTIRNVKKTNYTQQSKITSYFQFNNSTVESQHK